MQHLIRSATSEAWQLVAAQLDMRNCHENFSYMALCTRLSRMPEALHSGIAQTLTAASRDRSWQISVFTVHAERTWRCSCELGKMMWFCDFVARSLSWGLASRSSFGTTSLETEVVKCHESLDWSTSMSRSKRLCRTAQQTSPVPKDLWTNLGWAAAEETRFTCRFWILDWHCRLEGIACSQCSTSASEGSSRCCSCSWWLGQERAEQSQILFTKSASDPLSWLKKTCMHLQFWGIGKCQYFTPD